MKKIIVIICITTNLIAHNVKQITDNIETLLYDAQQTQNRIINVLKDIPYGIDVIDPGIKSMETITRLLKTRNAADEITDYSRVTIVVKDFPSIYWCLEELKKHVHIISIDDHYLYPYPEMYRDINIVYEDPINKHIGEIQINSRLMVDFKNTIGHEIFDRIRKIRAKEQLENKPLSQDDLDIIEDLTQMSKTGYNSTFKRSYCPIRLGVYGICIHEEKILMVKTWDGDKYIYNFPGGGIEEGEGLADCLLRECKEELGCEICIDKLLATSSKLYESSFFNNQKFNIYYVITLNGPLDYSLEGAIWFPLNQLPYDMMLDTDKDFANNFLKR